MQKDFFAIWPHLGIQKKIALEIRRYKFVSFNLYGWMNVNIVWYENFKKEELNVRYQKKKKDFCFFLVECAVKSGSNKKILETYIQVIFYKLSRLKYIFRHICIFIMCMYVKTITICFIILNGLRLYGWKINNLMTSTNMWIKQEHQQNPHDLGGRIIQNWQA